MNQETAKPRRVIFGGKGTTKDGITGLQGQCSFNGRGQVKAPVVDDGILERASQKSAPTKPEKTDVKEPVEKKLTRAQLKQAIEKKMVDAGLKYSKELHKKITPLKQVDLEAFLNDESNFMSETQKEVAKDAEQKKLGDEGKEPLKEEKPAGESTEDNNDALIAEIIKLQEGKELEEEVSKEELEEMSEDALIEYKEELLA